MVSVLLPIYRARPSERSWLAVEDTTYQHGLKPLVPIACSGFIIGVIISHVLRACKRLCSVRLEGLEPSKSLGSEPSAFTI